MEGVRQSWVQIPPFPCICSNVLLKFYAPYVKWGQTIVLCGPRSKRRVGTSVWAKIKFWFQNLCSITTRWAPPPLPLPPRSLSSCVHTYTLHSTLKLHGTHRTLCNKPDTVSSVILFTCEKLLGATCEVEFVIMGPDPQFEKPRERAGQE